MRGRTRASRRTGRLVVAVAAIAATVAAHAGAAPPVHPELNPLFTAELWLRGHTTVLDLSGVDATKPALRTQLLPGRDFVTDRPLAGDPLGHGTHVAALIAGNPQQRDGIFGVAPGAQILPLRVANARGQAPARAAAAALAYAARDPRVRVINTSWRKDFNPVVERELRAATRSGRARLVSAAGNDARDLSESRELPQTFDDVAELTVANTIMLDRLSWFSNYWAHVEVAAPGERILSAFHGDTLKLDDGTSMAAPIVSGMVALLFACHPEASAAQVKQARVPELGGRVGCGGIVNAPTALATLATILRQTPTDGSPRLLSPLMQGSAVSVTALARTGRRRAREGDPVAQAARIRAEVDARYRPRRVRLAVTEASSTGVIDSFTLFTGLTAEPRVVPAANGIYYALCPVGASCPYPGRSARLAAAFLPRRAALELAVRTFLETSADLVAVSLPTRRFVLLILERADVIGKVDAAALRDALRADPAASPVPSLRRVVDELTRPHLFAPSSLVPVSDTRETLVASSLFR
jgi:subtilisin family serine protease